MAWVYWVKEDDEWWPKSFPDKSVASVSQEQDEEDGFETSSIFYENDHGTCNARHGNVRDDDPTKGYSKGFMQRWESQDWAGLHDD